MVPSAVSPGSRNSENTEKMGETMTTSWRSRDSTLANAGAISSGRGERTQPDTMRVKVRVTTADTLERRTSGRRVS